jgi:predicted TIM-barrel fold metal-dependent hydrolase
VLDRIPNLKIVLSNLGGVLPFIVGRLDQYWGRVHAGARTLPQPPSEALRRFWYETASGHAAGIRMAAETIGADRLVFGSDYPSFDFVRAIQSVNECGLPQDDIDRILRSNAAKLLKLR